MIPGNIELTDEDEQILDEIWRERALHVRSSQAKPKRPTAKQPKTPAVKKTTR